MVFGCFASAAERSVFGVEVRFARLHGRGSSFFRPSESGVREFFGAAVLAGLGSFLGGVWLFRICRFLVWRCVLHGRVSSFFRPSESGVREFFGAAGLAGWA